MAIRVDSPRALCVCANKQPPGCVDVAAQSLGHGVDLVPQLVVVGHEAGVHRAHSLTHRVEHPIHTLDVVLWIANINHLLLVAMVFL
jgi:hypothetical protein